MRQLAMIGTSFLVIILTWGVFFPYLPGKVAMHFDAAGNPDQYGSKMFVMSMFLVLSFVLLSMTYLFVLYDRKNVHKRKINRPISIFFILFTWSLNSLFLLNTQDEQVRVEKLLFVLIGLFFIIIGNYMPAIKQNSSIGIRTKEALESKIVWNKTQRFGGFVFIVLGFLIACLVFVDGITAVYSSIISLALSLGIIMLYSKKQKEA